MKRSFHSSRFLLFAMVLLLVAGCATSSVNIQVLAPAQIDVPKDIQMLALVNRYRPEKGEGFLNVLEGAVTGENIGQDRRSAEEALNGLTSALAGSPRFRITRPNVELKGTGRGDFPPYLPNQEVIDICRNANAEGLVTIEAFDSDQTLTCTPQIRERKNKAGVTEKYTVFCSQKQIRVTVGWRMYEAQSGNIVDEFRMNETVSFNAEGPNEALAYANLPRGEAVTREIGRVTGLRYSQRISPTWLWVNRMYYKKGNENLKAGRKALKYDDWETASANWSQALQSADPKVQVRAMYNLALAAEHDGNLETALQFARDAGNRFDSKKARAYANLIRQRLRDQDRLDEQMEGAPK